MKRTLTIAAIMGLVLAASSQPNSDPGFDPRVPEYNLSLDSLKVETYSSSYKIESEYNPEGAVRAIREGRMKILFSGGFGRMPDFENDRDLKFQNTYNIEFIFQGCLHLGENEDEEGYNRMIFAHLDKQFGRQWRNEIRPDAIGFDLREITPNVQTLVKNDWPSGHETVTVFPLFNPIMLVIIAVIVIALILVIGLRRKGKKS